MQIAEALARDGEGKRPYSVAYHLEQAARASLDLQPRDRTLPDRAVKALTRGGDRARRAMESGTAVQLNATSGPALCGPR